MNLNQLIGVGLRQKHYAEVIEKQPDIGWFEVHSENFFHASPALNILKTIRKDYPISLHGVGLSLGSTDGIIQNHLIKLQELISITEPFLVSEHLSWGYVEGIYMPDLLPIAYTKESLKIFTQNISLTQDFLKREILIENPSSYLEYKISEIEEIDFMIELCKITGAKILLDINNIFVSCSNHGWNAKNYIDKIPKGLVKEIHLAGHSIKNIADDQVILVDTHDHNICEAVWDLYGYAIQKLGPSPTLFEWDAKIPELSCLIQEVTKAKTYLRKI